MTKAERTAKAEARAKLMAEIDAYHQAPMRQFTLDRGSIVETVYELGGAARRNRGHYTGDKVHRIRSAYVRRVLDADSRMRVGLWHCYPVCGCTQGQFAASPLPHAAVVTCTKCGG